MSKKAKLEPVADAYVCLTTRSNKKNKNLGKESKLLVLNDAYGFGGMSSHESCLTFLKFELPKGVEIQEAKLKVYVYDSAHCGSTVTIGAKQINALTASSDWEETKITGNNYPNTSYCFKKTLVPCENYNRCGQDIRLGGCTNHEELGSVEFDYTSYLSIQNSYTTVALEAGNENNAFALYSREADVEKNKKPRLEITYEHPKYRLSGMVYNAKTRNPIRNADVALNGHKTKSGSEGKYELEALSGSYTLSATKSGFRAYKESIELRKDTSKDIPLEAIVRKVEIIAEKTSGIRPISVSIDDEEEILKNVGDKTKFEFPPDATLTVTAKPSVGILSYQVKAKPAKGEEISGGIFWGIKFYNLRKINVRYKPYQTNMETLAEEEERVVTNKELKKSIDSLHEKVDTVLRNQHTLADNQDKITRNQENLRSYMDNQFSAMNTRFEDITSRIADLKSKLDHVASQLAEIFRRWERG